MIHFANFQLFGDSKAIVHLFNLSSIHNGTRSWWFFLLSSSYSLTLALSKDVGFTKNRFLFFTEKLLKPLEFHLSNFCPSFTWCHR